MNKGHFTKKEQLYFYHIVIEQIEVESEKSMNKVSFRP